MNDLTTSNDQIATVTSINKAAGSDSARQMISYPEHMTDVGDISAHIMGVLQSTLELEKLIELFDDELASSVPHDHLAYNNTEEEVSFVIGKPVRNTCSYRLVLFGKELGELTLSRNTKFLDDEIVKMENLISALIYPLRNALLYKQAVEKAYIDPLTGVSNRAAFDKTIEQEFELAKRHNNNLSLMMLDIDHFKQINDNFGHVVGDAVLKSFADCITDCMRRTDSIFRYGGEEFAILLRNAQLDGAALLAERMREKIENLDFDYESVSVSVTVSIGVAQLNADENSNSFIDRADKYLYAAKENGRNRVVAKKS